MENSTSVADNLSSANRMNGRVSEATTNVHNAVDQAAAAASSATQTVNSAIDRAAASGHQAVNKVEEKVEPAQRWINEKTDTVLALPQNAISDARQYVVTHPWQSLGMAVLAGVLLGRRSR